MKSFVQLTGIAILLFVLSGHGSGGRYSGKGSPYRVTICSFSKTNTSTQTQISKKRKTIPSKSNKTKKVNVPSEKSLSENLRSTSASLPHTDNSKDAASNEHDGEGTGEGDGTRSGAGWNLFGMEGLGKSRTTPPRYIENPKPNYPPEAKQKGYEGKVLLKVEVLISGRVGKVNMVRSSGYTMLDQAALETMKKWRFIPARRGEVPIPSWVTILLTFQLKEDNF